MRVLSRTALFLILAAPLGAQPSAPPPRDPAARKPLTLAEYGRWSRVVGTALSPDGRWATFAYQPNDGDPTVHVRRLDDTLGYAIAVGSGAEFSDDSRWLGVFVQPGEKEAERLRRQRRPVPRTAILLDLATGKRDSVPNAASLDFAEGGRWVAVKRARLDTTVKATGTDVVLRDLAAGVVRHLGSVGQLAFNAPAKGAATLLAYTVDAPDRAGNGVYLLELSTGRVTPLLGGAETFDGLAWDESGTRLAVLHGNAPDRTRYRANALAAFTGLGGGAAPARVDLAAAAVPKDLVLSENATPRWSRDGARVFVGLRAQEADPSRGEDPAANVDVWHWKDADVQSVQMVRAAQDRRYTYAASFDLGARSLVRLANDTLRTVTYVPGGALAIARDELPYRGTVQWGGARGDYYALDPRTGARTPIARGLTRTMGTSPDGRWFLYLKDGKVLAHDLHSGKAVNLSDAAGVDFVDADDDHPYERPAYGVAGWSKDGKSVLLHHRFDVWQVPLAGGKAVNLTRGVGDSARIRFRVARLDLAGGARRGGRGGAGFGAPARDDEGIDLTRPLVLQAFGEWTKKSGYWIREPDGRLRPLVYDDRAFDALARAEKGSRVLFTRQTFEESPDVWTAPDVAALAKATRLTNANPQLAEYAWGKRLLVDYVNGKGQKLQGTLTLPANYEPGKRYPTIVYFYEKLSQNLHQFSMPVYDDRPHFSTYASNGYLIFMPDIVYEEGRPGSSALDCVTSGVKKIVELGYADPQRIGIQGHSWGGYESSFIITQTDMFRAAVIGAPPANLVSMYDQLYKNTGTVNNGIFEIGQVRMGDNRNPWTAHELYESQSPVHQVRNIKTPFLILQGTDDGAVDWLQGVELYNAARRWGKNVIFLSYPGENHHLARKENTKDFQVRMKQYFDHYLKGAPAPAWMTDGVPHLRKGTVQP